MRARAFVFLPFVALPLVALPVAARADDVIMTNKTGAPVYRLYVWPTELVPRTYDVLGGLPLFDGDERRIHVDNNYQDCRFTVQADPNDPSDLQRKDYLRKPMTTREVDLCEAEHRILLQ